MARTHEGPGEMGKAVIMPKEDQEKMKELFKINQFNLMASDMIALNRSLPDVRLDGWALGMAGLMVSQCKSLCARACWVKHINHTDSNHKGASFLIYLMLFLIYLIGYAYALERSSMKIEILI